MLKICSRIAAASTLVLTGLPLPSAVAQAPPATDIHLAELVRDGLGGLEVVYRCRATDRDGYDNQPFFLRDDSGFLYTSIRKGQADIYRYDLASKKSVPVTRTTESEYSPKVIPGGKGFSVVRVESSEPLVQRLWRFDLDGGNARCVLEDVNPVGYHAWGSADALGLFVLGEPPTLTMATLKDGARAVKASEIGRCVATLVVREVLRPFHPAVSFVDRSKADEPWIRILELRSGDVRPVVKALDGVDDHVWTPRGELISARGSKLYGHFLSKGGGWTELGDLQAGRVSSITRLAVSRGGSMLAFVAARAESEDGE